MRIHSTFSFTAPIVLLALAGAGRQASVEPLSAEAKRSTIDSLITAMNETYVFPETAKKVEADLKARLAGGEYDTIDQGAMLAQKLTEEMNSICKDAHLRVRFSKDPLPIRENRDRPSKAEEEQQVHFIRLMNGGISSAERLIGNVGYIDTTGFMPREFAARAIDSAMAFMQDTDALIIDMRHNGGGDPDTVRYFCSYLFDKKPVLLNTIWMRGDSKAAEFWTLDKLPGTRYLKKDVYVLSGKRTGSGAEEFCYDLKNLHRALIVGESTWGGANPGSVARLNDHFSAFIPHGRAINPYTKTNWEGTGVEPDIKVPADDSLKTALGLAIRRLQDKATAPFDKDRLSGALKEVEAGHFK
jgi:hypothetical protein